MTISLSNIEIFAYHGVLPEETELGGWYVLGLSVELNAKASETDCLEDTVNYAEIYELVKEEMSTPSKLIEHVAGRIARRIRIEFSIVEKVTVKITKKHPPIKGANINASVELCY